METMPAARLHKDYFGFGPASQKIYDVYPYSGFGNYAVIP
jgi:hypothetical protein